MASALLVLPSLENLCSFFLSFSLSVLIMTSPLDFYLVRESVFFLSFFLSFSLSVLIMTSPLDFHLVRESVFFLSLFFSLSLSFTIECFCLSLSLSFFQC